MANATPSILQTQNLGKNQELKLKLSDKICSNFYELSLLSKQITKSSKSYEHFEKMTRNFASQEVAIENSLINLKKIGLLVSNLQFQADATEKSFQQLEDIKDHINSIQKCA